MTHNMMHTTAKLSGSLLETVSRSHPPKAFNINGGRKSKVEQSLSTYISDEEHALEIKAHSINNTIRTFKRYVFANFSKGFTLLTLTFNDACDFDVTDISICKDKFTLYWKNLKRSRTLAGVDLRYLGVQEFQKTDMFTFIFSVIYRYVIPSICGQSGFTDIYIADALPRILFQRAKLQII